MENREKLTIKINHLAFRVKEIQDKIDKHNAKIREYQEALVKYEVDIEIAGSIKRDNDKLVKLMNERSRNNTNLLNLEAISFTQELDEITQINNLIEKYKSERDGSGYEEFENLTI